MCLFKRKKDFTEEEIQEMLKPENRYTHIRDDLQNIEDNENEKHNQNKYIKGLEVYVEETYR